MTEQEYIMIGELTTLQNIRTQLLNLDSLTSIHADYLNAARVKIQWVIDQLEQMVESALQTAPDVLN